MMKTVLKYWPIIVFAIGMLVAVGTAKARLDEQANELERLLLKEQENDKVFDEIFERGVRVETNLELDNQTLRDIRDDTKEMRQDIKQLIRENRR